MHNTPQQFAVIGSAGRLGSDLARVFGDQCLPISRKEMDLSSPVSIRRCLDPLDVSHLILTASLTGVDYCEDHPEEAFQINAEAPRLIAEIAAQKGIHLTYISTDFVFDGVTNKYLHEKHPTSPVSVYGASKLKGEDYILEASSRNLVARVSWLYGPARAAFPEWIIDKASYEKELSLPGNKIACPTSSPDVALLLKSLLLDHPLEAKGIFNVCNSGSCSWQEWGQACLDEIMERGVSLSTQTIGLNQLEDIAAFKAKRPEYSALDNTKLAKVLGAAPRHWRIALREHLEKSSFRNPIVAAA